MPAVVNYDVWNRELLAVVLAGVETLVGVFSPIVCSVDRPKELVVPSKHKEVELLVSTMGAFPAIQNVPSFIAQVFCNVKPNALSHQFSLKPFSSGL